MARFHLYFDDSGTRQSDKAPDMPRRDGMDHFALGGILISETEIGTLLAAHRAFTDRWKINTPLHSTRIRGRRGGFSWLATDSAKEADFLADLEAMLLGLPVLGIACVIDRPGYVARYADRYQTPWLLCKTAFAILIERAAKYAARSGGWLEIYFEQAGQKEDRDILSYARALETEGMPFDSGTSGAYQGLQPDDFKALIVGQPNRITKATPMAQVADLLLYPLAKGGYEPTYRPYAKLMEAGRVIDAALKPEERPSLGVKYSCFDKHKK